MTFQVGQRLEFGYLTIAAKYEEWVGVVEKSFVSKAGVECVVMRVEDPETKGLAFRTFHVKHMHLRIPA